MANILVLTPDVAEYIADFSTAKADFRVTLHNGWHATLRSGSLTFHVFSLDDLSGSIERLMGASPSTWTDVWVYCTSAKHVRTAAECLQVVTPLVGSGD